MSEAYKPCVEDATGHIHVRNGSFAPWSRALCSSCPPMTAEEDAEELRKYLAYEKRERLKYATRKPSKTMLGRLRRIRKVVTGMLR